MPPRTKINKERILQAAIEVARQRGFENINARTVSEKLDCSTQPVMYHFKTVSELKASVYDAANEVHTAYIMAPDSESDNPFLSIGLRYIQFAADEKHLFSFLFQSDSFQNVSFGDLINADGLAPVIAPLCQAAAITELQAREVFEQMFICVHGAASLIANNSIQYDKTHFEELLGKAFDGAICTLKGRS